MSFSSSLNLLLTLRGGGCCGSVESDATKNDKGKKYSDNNGEGGDGANNNNNKENQGAAGNNNNAASGGIQKNNDFSPQNASGGGGASGGVHGASGVTGEGASGANAASGGAATGAHAASSKTGEGGKQGGAGHHGPEASFGRDGFPLPCVPSGPGAGGGLVPQEFAYVRDIVGEFAKIDPSLRRRVRIEPEFILLDISTGKIVSDSSSSSSTSGGGNNNNNSFTSASAAAAAAGGGSSMMDSPNTNSNLVALRKGSMVSNDEARILRIAVDTATRLQKANNKLSTSWYFRQPYLVLFDETQQASDAQQQKYTGLPTIAAADRSQDLSGAHAVVSTIEMMLNDILRATIDFTELWKNSRDGNDEQEQQQQQQHIMEKLLLAVSARVFASNSMWSSVAEQTAASAAAKESRNKESNAAAAAAGTTTAASAAGGTSNNNDEAAKKDILHLASPSAASAIENSPSSKLASTFLTPQQALIHARFVVVIRTAVRLLFLSIGGAEYACSPNEHGVPPLPAFDVLVALLLRRAGPLLASPSPSSKKKLREEVTHWMRFLCFIGLVPEVWEAFYDRQVKTGGNADPHIPGSAGVMSSPFCQLPVFLLSPLAISQLLTVEFALRSPQPEQLQPPQVRTKGTAVSELLYHLLQKNSLPTSQLDLKPDHSISPMTALRYLTASSSSSSSANNNNNNNNNTSVANKFAAARGKLPYSFPAVRSSSSSASFTSALNNNANTNDYDFAIVPSPADFEVMPVNNVLSFFDSVSRPFFGCDSRFGVKSPPPIDLHSLFKSVTLEYCSVQITNEPEFLDTMFAAAAATAGDNNNNNNNNNVQEHQQQQQQQQQVLEKLVPTRVVLTQPADSTSSGSCFVPLTAVDDGDVIVLDGDSYVIHKREFKTIDLTPSLIAEGNGGGGGGGGGAGSGTFGGDEDSLLPHAVFNAPTQNTGGDSSSSSGGGGGVGRVTDYRSVVIHLRSPFEAPPFAARRETLSPSAPNSKAEILLTGTRSLFSAPSVDYATFVLAGEIQAAMMSSNQTGAAGAEDRLDDDNANFFDEDGGGGNSAQGGGGGGPGNIGSVGGIGSLIQQQQQQQKRAGGGDGDGTGDDEFLAEMGGGGGEMVGKTQDDVTQQLQTAYSLGWVVGSSIASGVSLNVPLPALLFRILKTFVMQKGFNNNNNNNNGYDDEDEDEEGGHRVAAGENCGFHCLFQASEADVLEMMPRISAVVDDIRRLSTMRFIDLVRMEGLGSIMTKDEYITSVIAEPIVFPVNTFAIYEAVFAGIFDSGLRNSPLWVLSSPLAQQRIVTTTCLEDDDRNTPHTDRRDWDIRVGFMPFTPDAVALEERFSDIVESVVVSLPSPYKRELLRRSLGLLRPPAGSDHVFSIIVAIGSLEFEISPTASDFEEELHESPFVRPMDNILRVPNYLEAILFRPDGGLFWNWYPHQRPSRVDQRVSPDVLENSLQDLTQAQQQELSEAVAQHTADRLGMFLLPHLHHKTFGQGGSVGGQSTPPVSPTEVTNSPRMDANLEKGDDEKEGDDHAPM